MTNAQIIFNESVRLMEQGVLQGTGETVEIQMEDGTKKVLEIPEEIHTYNGWKARGFQVQKGQKSIAQFVIWKHTSKMKEIEDSNGNKNEYMDNRMFMKKSSFFKASQVLPI